MANNAPITLADLDADVIARRSRAQLRGHDVVVPTRSMRRLALPLTAGLAALVLTLWLFARPGAAILAAEIPTHWNFFARTPFAQQLTGYVALGLFALALLLPSRRLPWLGRRRESARLVHAMLGSAICITLVLHTSARLGRGLNLWLSTSLLALTAMGVVLALVWRATPPQPPIVGHTLRPLHIWFWAPALGLIAAHVLAVTYF